MYMKESIRMNKRRLSSKAMKSQFFKKMFLSYVIIILLSLFMYSAAVVYENVRTNRTQTEQYYETKIQTLANTLDQQFYSAQRIVSSINSSTIINKFYINVQMEASVDTYLLYQFLQTMANQKTAADNLYIYDLVFLIDGYDKAYTSGDVIQLSNSVQLLSEETIIYTVSDLNTLVDMENYQLIFNKPYLIYQSSYRNGSGAGKGAICILFEKTKLENLVESVLGKNLGYTLYHNEEKVLTKEVKDARSFQVQSQSQPSITYEIMVQETEFGFQISLISSFALLFGIVISVFFLLLAYVFATRNYSPFQSIRLLVGDSNQNSKDERKSIVEDVANLIGEKNGYLRKMTTISPYAKRGILHGMITGNLNGEYQNLQEMKELVELNGLFGTVAVVNIAYIGHKVCDKEVCKKIKNIIEEISTRFTKEDIKFLCCERNLQDEYIIINSNDGEKIEDCLYDFFESLKESVNYEDYVLTMGVEEVKEDLVEFGVACDHAMQSLDRILIEGRGSVYFYDENVENNIGYFIPKDIVKLFSKFLLEGKKEELHEMLLEIEYKNCQEYDLSNSSIQLMLSELYVSVVKAVQGIQETFDLHTIIKKCEPYHTFEEVIRYYETKFHNLMAQMKEVGSLSDKMQQIDLQIIDYINDNDKSPEISLTQIAEKFNVTSKYVTTVIKQKYGITYLQYVQERRINYALDLLKDTNLPLEKIAEMCGYSNILTFRRNFKSIMKLNPSDVRIDNN